MGRLSIEVVYATRESEDSIQLNLERGARVIDALRASGLSERHPEIGDATPALGIFGVRVTADTPLQDGDRIEIYRPLNTDPKALRRRNARPARGGRSQ